MSNNETLYQKPPVFVPKNESKACDAVVKTMENALGRNDPISVIQREIEKDRQWNCA